ncbi:hypothetical protein J2W30_004646 [Variovorax boronicumulans]|uniref:protealysin inhibitor emfourin n=1 Tax=Variovorax boronicumulans TaxID=436515 RepID=UPI0027858C0F|nr:protealysin inhibitor emfourin [Variovorax boronicumulans]MDQ0036871.1 hypothetical protein [Variovorax boronicumulans]
MIRLPPLDRIRIVRIARDGGVAWTPGLSRPRSFLLEGGGDAERHRIEEALQGAAQCGEESGTCAPGGDQRFYRVEVVARDTAKTCASLYFEVPEGQAPDALVHLWKQAG